MGEVYKARDTRLDRTVAIKVLPQTLAADPQFRERFEREARAISQLIIRTSARCTTSASTTASSFLVMEYLEGETLAAPAREGRAAARPGAHSTRFRSRDALDNAHRAGIVHRDLKPGNIMLTKAGAKLLDFGLAKAAAPSSPERRLSMLPTTPSNLTAQGTILGTFQYMAPEQLEGQRGGRAHGHLRVRRRRSTRW